MGCESQSAVSWALEIITAHSSGFACKPHLMLPVNPGSTGRARREEAGKVGWGIVSKLSPHL